LKLMSKPTIHVSDAEAASDLRSIMQSGPPPLRTALVSGVYSNFDSQSSVVLPFICYDDPLADALTTTGIRRSLPINRTTGSFR
jgi:hypothetical protein